MKHFFLGESAHYFPVEPWRRWQPQESDLYLRDLATALPVIETPQLALVACWMQPLETHNLCSAERQVVP